MWGTLSSIFVKYWFEVFLGLIVTGGGLFFKRYFNLEVEKRNASRKEYYAKLTKDIKDENKILFDSLKQEHDEISQRSDDRYHEIISNVDAAMKAGRIESKADDAHLQNQISEVSTELNCLKAGMLSMQGKEFRANCRKLLEENHEITLDEWEEIDADHDAYNGLGGNHRGDALFEMVKKKVENTLTE